MKERFCKMDKAEYIKKIKIRDARNNIENYTLKKNKLISKIRQFAELNDCNYKNSSNVNVVFSNCLRQIALNTAQSNKLIQLFEKYAESKGVIYFNKRYLKFNDIEIKDKSKKEAKEENENDKYIMRSYEEILNGFEDFSGFSKAKSKLVKVSKNGEEEIKGVKIILDFDDNKIQLAINHIGINCNLNGEIVNFESLKNTDQDLYELIIKVVYKNENEGDLIG